MTTHDITLCGSDVRYWTYGPDSAPASRTILAVHGFRGNHVGLERIIAALPTDIRVIVPDLPACGVSTPMTALPHDVAGYASFVESFANAVGLDRPVLLGHSFGTIVAARIAATRPELIGDLILVNPIAARPNAGVNWPVSKLVELFYLLGETLPESLGQRVIGSRTFNRLMSLSLSKTHDPAIRRGVYRHHLSDLAFPQHREAIAQSFRDSITLTVADYAERIPARTLLIAGEKDGIAPAKSQRRLHAIMPGSSLVIIPDVGHLVHLETPAEAAEAMAAFLR